jgi:hypothetical protein
MTIQVTPNIIEVTPGNLFSIFTLNITLIDAHDVAGIQFKVTWNSTILTCTSATMPSGHFMDPEGVEAAEGNLWLLIPNGVKKYTGYADYGVTYQDMGMAQSRGTAPRSGNGTLAVLTMNATAVGVTEIHFNPDDTVIGDLAAVQLPLVMDDGTVTVIPELNLTMLALLLPIMTLLAFTTRRLLPKRK